MHLMFSPPKIKLSDNMIVGSDFEVFAVITNNCMEAKTCTFMFFATAVTYNGKRGDSCGFFSEKVEVPAREGKLSKSHKSNQSLDKQVKIAFRCSPRQQTC